MNEIILLKIGEIILKGQNKRYFEQKLMSNVNKRLSPFGDFEVYCMQSTIYVEPRGGSCDLEGAYAAMRTVFGIVSVSKAAECEKDKDAIFETAKRYLKNEMETAESFKVESRRSDKRFGMTSIELSQYVGGRLHDAFSNIRVDVKKPALTVNIEVRDLAAYVHAAPAPGAGGMPVGTSGRAVSLLSGGIDSPVSSYMIAKRGVSVIPVHFYSFPYTSEQAKQKVVALTRILTRYCGRLTLEVVPFTKIQEEIRKNCPEALFTLIMRRFMMRIAQKIADYNGCGAIVTGENLGQVASQTMEAMAVTEACAELPVLRPLIGLDKEEIVTVARKIGTFETSILPFEDCCTIFTPRHPRLKPKLEEVIDAESKLDVQGLIEEAVRDIERIRLDL